MQITTRTERLAREIIKIETEEELISFYSVISNPKRLFTKTEQTMLLCLIEKKLISVENELDACKDAFEHYH